MRITPNDNDLDMMIAKFIINLPHDELRQDRIWVHLEKIFYYFIDEVVDLEPLSDFQQHDREMKEFFTLVVQKLPSFLKLDANKILKIISDGYSNTPVYGVVIFNLQQTKILLVQSHKPANMYGVPKGKINEGETPLQCACRQVKQEVGINVQLSQNHKIEIFYNKNCLFYICKMDQSNINVSFNKNTQAQKLKGKKKTSKEIKSLVWFELHNPDQLRLNVATKKVIDKIKSDRAIYNNSRQNSNGKTASNNGRGAANGYTEGDRGRKSTKYIQIPNQNTSNWYFQRETQLRCPFDEYEIRNRKMYERIFYENTD